LRKYREFIYINVPSTLNTKVAEYSEMLVHLHQITQYHITA